MSRLIKRVAFITLAVVVAGGQTMTASGAPSSVKSRPHDKRQRIEAEQADAASAGEALGLGSGEKLLVTDVITDRDGSTNVRYNRTYDGLRVIGGDLVSHLDVSGTVESVSRNTSRPVAVASTTPRLSRASANAAGARNASLVQKTTTATKSELVVYSGGASGKAAPKLA